MRGDGFSKAAGKRKAPERAPSVDGTLLLQSKLAVRWLPSPLAVRLGSFFGLEVFGDGAEFVDVAAGETRAVRSVPVLLKDHRAAAAWADPGWSRLHRFPFPLLLTGLPPEAPRLLGAGTLGQNKKAQCQQPPARPFVRLRG